MIPFPPAAKFEEGLKSVNSENDDEPEAEIFYELEGSAVPSTADTEHLETTQGSATRTTREQFSAAVAVSYHRFLLLGVLAALALRNWKLVRECLSA